MKFDAEVKREIHKISVGCCICTAVTMLAFLFMGRFNYTVAIGGALGLAVSVGNFYLMCEGVVRALDTGDESVAKLKLRSSYAVRTIMQIGVIALAITVDFISWIPVVIAVFYPRITITACNLWTRIARRKDNHTPEKLWKT